MNKFMKKMKDNKGVTLLELIVAIAVSSIALLMLMQVLFMSIQVRTQTFIDHRVKTESFLLVEDIKRKVFDHETQRVTYAETVNDVTVTFHHDYIVEFDSLTGAISYTDVNEDMILVFDKTTGIITVDGTRLHSTSVILDPLTSITVTPVESTCNATTTGCEDVVVTITLHISILLENGSLSDVEIFETTFII